MPNSENSPVKKRGSSVEGFDIDSFLENNQKGKVYEISFCIFP